MSVFERTREMGVLRALGLRPGKLVWLVILESFFLAAVATTIGLVLGGLLDWYLVVHGLDFTSSTPDGFSFEGVMLDPVMKGSVRAWPIIATVISVFFVSILASLWPAWRAAHLQPVEAIRTE
jgi:putative ABC transport system permease protein